MEYFIAIDQGTHATRALLFDQSGNQVASKWSKVGLNRKQKGWIEQDALELLNSVLEVINGLLDELSEQQRESIKACGISTQRSSVVMLDDAGQAISPVLSWQDVRAADFLATIKEAHPKIQSLTGLPVSAHYGASKLRWLTKNLAESESDNGMRLAPLVSYFLYHLLADNRFCVDHSNAQRTQLLDLNTLDWSPELLKMYSLQDQRLPESLPMVAPYGELLDTGIPFMASSGDQNAAVFGAGDLPDDTALVNLGSGAFILRRTETRQLGDRLLTSVSYSDDATASYLREGTVNGSGTALSWATEHWELDDTRENLSKWCELIEEPPVFINAVGGLGSPWWRRDVEPVLLDEKPHKNEALTKAARAVAVGESILFLLNDNLNLMRREQPIKRLRLSGGLSQQDAICQKFANLTGLPVERIDNPEATARGTAWLAAGRPDNWDQLEVEQFLPRPDPGLQKRYRRSFEYLRTLPPLPNSVPALVAHRGYMSKYAENTLLSISAALGAGAPHVEFDVQMAGDGELVVIHDDNTKRTADVAHSVFDLSNEDLQRISVHYPEKFESAYSPEPVPTLQQALSMMAEYPAATAFIEIKEESFQHFGLAKVMDKLILDLANHSAPFFVISFSFEAVHYLQQNSNYRTGWVLKKYNKAFRKRAEELQPDCLICNHKKIPADEQLWPGIWDWMLYDIKDPETAMHFHQLGAQMIETAEIGELLSDLKLHRGKRYEL